MTMTIREAFDHGTAAFNKHDIQAWSDILDDDVVFEAPGGLRGRGKPACADFYASWFRAFPDAHVDVHGTHIIDDVATEEGTFTGTHNGVLQGPTGDISPTGRPVKVGYIQVIRFRNGKCASFNLAYDRLAMLEQLGLVPGSAAAKSDRPFQPA